MDARLLDALSVLNQILAQPVRLDPLTGVRGRFVRDDHGTLEKTMVDLREYILEHHREIPPKGDKASA